MKIGTKKAAKTSRAVAAFIYLFPQNLKIIKICPFSSACHVVAVHAEVGAGEALTLFIGEDVGGDFGQFTEILSVQGLVEFRVQAILGGDGAQEQGAVFGDGNRRDYIIHCEVAASD